MKIIVSIGVLAVIAIAGYFFWFQADSAPATPNETETEAAASAVSERSSTEMEAGTYAVDTSASSIQWEAAKPAISGYVHHGTFALSSGSVTLTDQALTGQFVIDVDSVKVTSLGGGKSGQESALENHLKSADFFDTAAYPTATFTITNVEPKVFPGPDQSEYQATGELSLKGITKTVTFPIKVVVDSNDKVRMTAVLTLDRTEWGIDFGSAKFVKAITNQVIGDTVNLNVAMTLTK